MSTPTSVLDVAGDAGKYPGRREAMMEKSKKSHKVDYGCESRCVEKFVECVEAEGGASICKTRERNCFDECKL